MKKIFALVLFVAILFFCQLSVAEAAYVLPYPSVMPGNKMYRITRVADALKNYWYWGSIAQTKFHLGLSDKYLVEAKTLMEYNQYLLAAEALKRSDSEFKRITGNIQEAKGDGKDISAVQKTVIAAADKHTEVIYVLAETVPDQFTWTPEKSESTELKLKDMLAASERIRSQVLAEVSSL